MNDNVLILDNATWEVHRTGGANMSTLCGLRLESLSVGPAATIRSWSKAECPKCFPENAT